MTAIPPFGLEAQPTPDGTLPGWAPTADDIAKVVPAYTVGGFDDDNESAGSQQGAYTDTTEPTVTEVGGLILVACTEVEGRVGMPVETRNWKLARAAAIWHVAMDISSGKQPAGTADAGGEYRGYLNNFIAAMTELTRLGRMPLNSRLR